MVFHALKSLNFNCVKDRESLSTKNETRGVFCVNPLDVIRDTVNFCELGSSREFEKFVTNYSVKNTNYKWKEELTDDQHKILDDILQDHLKRYDYV